MNINKNDLRKEISNLRYQLAKLEERCREREDNYGKLIDKLVPYLEVLSKESQQDLLKSLKETEL